MEPVHPSLQVAETEPNVLEDKSDVVGPAAGVPIEQPGQVHAGYSERLRWQSSRA